MQLKDSTIVVDIGSRWIKTGFAGNDEPTSLLQTASCGQNEIDQNTCYTTETKDVGSMLTTPSGIVTEWGAMETILEHAMHKGLGQPDVRNNPLVVTGTPMTYAANSANFAELLFETFLVPSLHMAPPHPLSLSAHGTDTGVVVDIGHQFSTAMTLHRGNCIGSGFRRIAVAGNTLTQYLLFLLKRDYFADSPQSYDVAQGIKHKLCHVALDYDSIDFTQIANETVPYYFRNTKSPLSVKKRYIHKACEPLFRPGMIGVGIKGIHHCIEDMVKTCADGLQSELYSHIYLTGGSTYLNGFEDRLRDELRTIVPVDQRIHIHRSEFGRTIGGERVEISAWVGGSRLADSNDLQDKWISKKDYDEIGPGVFDRH